MKKIRDVRYDFIKVIAMELVILIHALDTIKIGPGLTNQIWREVVTSLIMICNPLFFMMSGHFNLHFRGFERRDYQKYYQKKIINIVIPLVFYQFIYYITSIYVTNSFHGLREFLYLFVVNVFQNYTATYFWFMYALIAFLMAAPFMSKMLDNLTENEQLIFTEVLLGLQVISWGLKLAGINLGIIYPFSGWLMYFLLGRLIENKKAIARLEQLLVVILVVVINSLLVIVFPQSREWGLHDLSPLYILLSVVIYLGLLNNQHLKKIATSKIISFLAQHSFSIYLCHGAILLGLNSLLVSTQPQIHLISIAIGTYVGALILSGILDALIINPIKNYYFKKIISRI